MQCNRSGNARLYRRSQILLALSMGLLLYFCFWFVRGSGLIYGADPEVDQTRAVLAEEIRLAEVTEGAILDRDGQTVSEGLSPGEPGLCYQPYAYGYLIGYSSKLYGSSGLRNRYDTVLHCGDKDGVGATLQLTTDSSLQQYAYQLLGEMPGSIIVLDNRDGGIIALASRVSTAFNVNQIDEDWENISAQEGMLLTLGVDDWTDPPGSVFKLVTAAAALEAGYTPEQLTYQDTGSYDADGFCIRNAGNAVFGELDLCSALVNSSNTYFAGLAVSLGGYALQQQAERFCIGTEVALDFATLHSSFDLGDMSAAGLAQTGFGQGKTGLSPLHLAMIYQSIANEGQMLRPYLVQRVSQGKQVLAQGKKTEMEQPVSRETARALQEMLHQAALQYGFDEEAYGWVAAKTGTAELGDGSYHIYLCGFSEQYTFVLSRNQTSAGSSSLFPAAAALLKALRQESDNSATLW